MSVVVNKKESHLRSSFPISVSGRMFIWLHSLSVSNFVKGKINLYKVSGLYLVWNLVSVHQFGNIDFYTLNKWFISVVSVQYMHKLVSEKLAPIIQLKKKCSVPRKQNRYLKRIFGIPKATDAPKTMFGIPKVIETLKKYSIPQRILL